jgi:transposase
LEQLQAAMESAPNKRSYIRLAAMRCLLRGMSRADVADIFCRSDRMVRLWILKYNQGGIDALLTRPAGGRKRKVSLQRLDEVLVPVLKNPAQAAIEHWTGVKVHGWLKKQLQTDLSYSTVLRYLHDLDFHLRVPRPWPLPLLDEPQREVQREAFREQIQQLAQDPDVELWFGDECGVDGDPRPRRRWVQPGSKPKVPHLGKHIRRNVIGAVCPQTGELFSLLFDGVDSAVFQCWLDELAQSIPANDGVRRLLVLDNASWHKVKTLHWHHFEPLFLPPYSPDFNPIERLWLRMKADFFTDWIARNSADLEDRLCAALNHFMAHPHQTASICSFRK